MKLVSYRPEDQETIAGMEDFFRQMLAHDGAVLIELAEADASERAASRAVEPGVPVSAGRNLA